MRKSDTYHFVSNREEKIINKLLDNYLRYKENMKLVNNDFNFTTLCELSTEELLDKIKSTNEYLIQKTTSSEKYTKTWLYIYENEILRRRIEKINKICNKIK